MAHTRTSSSLLGPRPLSAYSEDSDSSYEETRTPSSLSFTPFTPSVYLTWNKSGADYRSFSLSSLPSAQTPSFTSHKSLSHIADHQQRTRCNSDPAAFMDKPLQIPRRRTGHKTHVQSMYNKPRPLPIRPLPTPSSSASSSGRISFSIPTSSSPSSYGFSSPELSSPGSSPSSSAPSTPPPHVPLRIECKSSLATRRKIRCLPIPPPLVFPAIAPTECSTPLAMLPVHDKDGDGIEELDWDVLNDILCSYSDDTSVEG